MYEKKMFKRLPIAWEEKILAHYATILIHDFRLCGYPASQRVFSSHTP